MSNNLIIVESPAKVKTIKKFLGSSYQVIASGGHVRDMPKSQLGIGPENDYEPKYITIRGKGPVLADIRKEVKKAEKIYLATDPDREGEAISWHLTESLNLEGKKVYRITFQEITRKAVLESLKHARTIDRDLVDAQQARRALDRIVGYKISPLLWKKVKNGLSAGRVQSVALRLIGEREEEVNAFLPEEYWTAEGLFQQQDKKQMIPAKFYGSRQEKRLIHSNEEMDRLKRELLSEIFTVEEVKRGKRSRQAPPPFTTSTMQQEAVNVLNFPTSKTMRIAQQLYEGIEIKGQGAVGLITYLRTDSTRVSEEAGEAARAYIEENYGAEYMQAKENHAKAKSNIQDAHEAIRPTDLTRTPENMKEWLSRDQYRLYQLIWKRFTASCMSRAVYETCGIKICGDKYCFTNNASRLVFQGFLSVYQQGDEEEEDGKYLADIAEGSRVKLQEMVPRQHFTQPPPHYTEASLVKNLEELGIGRPSTYAPIITTLLKRRYITKEKKNLYMTEIGEVVNHMMKEAFPVIVDTQFTANVESLLDSVAEGKTGWKTIIRNFYPDVEAAVEKAEKELEAVKIQEEITEEICEKCGKNMVIKYGPHGRFLACPGFPDCRNTKPYFEKIGVPCPKCQADLVQKTTQKGRRFYGCINFPECDFVSWQKPVTEKCPVCGAYLVEKGKYLICSQKECGYRKETENE